MSVEPMAFVTMVRGDHEMLSRWITHYAALVPDRQALHVFLHGHDERLLEMAKGCSVNVLPFDPSGRGFEDARRNLFFGMVRVLRGYYRHVICVDTDEFLAIDPDLGVTLADYLDGQDFESSALSPVGFDVVQRCSVETEDADMTRPLLAQRSYGFADGVYSKPCIFRRSPRRGTQHMIRNEPWNIDPNLTLFHFRFFDRAYGQRVSRQRAALVAQFDESGAEHNIGTWRDRTAAMERVLTQMDSETPADFDAAARDAFCERQMHNHRTHGRLVWRDARHGPYCIPQRFKGLL